MVSHPEPTLSRRRFMYGALAGAAVVAAQPILGSEEAGAVPVLARPNTQDRVKIVHWGHPLTEDDMTFFDPIIKQFQDAGNAIDVEIELQPWDARIERKLTAFAAGTSPDSSYLNTEEFAQYADQGALVALDSYVTAEDLDDLLPGPRGATTWAEKVWNFPVLFTPTYPFYNREIFEKSGLDPDKPPTTWEEIETAFAAIKKAKDDGKHDAWPTAIPELESVSVTYFPWLYQAGGSMLNADGKSGFDTPEAAEAAEFAVHLGTEYNSPGNNGAKFGVLEEQFFTGQSAYHYLAETRLIKRWQDDFPDFQLDVAPQTGKVQQAGLGGTGSCGLWASSGNTNPDAAWAWVDYLTNEGNLIYNQGAGFTPARVSVLNTYAADAHPAVKKAMELDFPYATIAEKHPKTTAIQGALDPEMQAAFAGDKSPAEAMQAAAAKINTDVLV